MEQEFIEEILKLYKKYNLSISHEDNQGAFIITRYSKENENWFREAIIDVESDENTKKQ